MPKGYLAFILHAHLPFVRHPEHDSFLEERWLYEAITETYIPLIKAADKLIAEDVPFKLTISISPSLLVMLEDKLLTERYIAHLSKLIELTDKELDRTMHDPHFHYLAGMYKQLFTEAMDIFVNRCNGRLSSLFGLLHKSSKVELITTTATHAVMPLFSSQPSALKAQLKTGLEYFEDVFGFRPQGLWLPECGYCPGLEEFLNNEGIKYFFLESHGLENAGTTPFYSVYTPLYTPSGVAAFGRDRGSTKEVWSAQEGFPGDPDYREFYRDIGHDLDFEYVKPYIADNIRADTGIKYYRITGPTAWKEPYYPDRAKEKAALHAGDFLHKRASHIEHLDSVMSTSPVIVAPFDAELFGHWWFEGPQWLDFVIRKAAFDQDSLELITLSEYLDRHPVHQASVPSTSTWGHMGYFETWLNDKTDYIYPQLRECCHRMEELALKFGTGKVSALKRRVLNQCVRELLLAQSSDWPFIIYNATAAEYADRRARDHIARFHYLAEALDSDSINEEYLAAIEEMDNIFPKADYKHFLDKSD